jgi:hypothetical protein
VPQPFKKRRRTTLQGRFVAAVAKPIYVCSRPGCGVHHSATFDSETHHWLKPEACLGCGGITFDYFQTKGEADRWASLLLQEKAGLVRKLRRQVRYGLFTIAPNGLQIHVADYIADFVYEKAVPHSDQWEDVVEDVKPKSGADPVAVLKLKWMAAQRGKPVTIYKV